MKSVQISLQMASQVKTFVSIVSDGTGGVTADIEFK